LSLFGERISALPRIGTASGLIPHARQNRASGDVPRPTGGTRGRAAVLRLISRRAV